MSDMKALTQHNSTCDSILAPLCNSERCCRAHVIQSILLLASVFIIVAALIVGVIWFYNAFRGARIEYKKRMDAKRLEEERQSIVMELNKEETKHLRRMSEMHTYPVPYYDK